MRIAVFQGHYVRALCLLVSTGLTGSLIAGAVAAQGTGAAPLVAAPSVTVATVQQRSFVAQTAISGSVVARQSVSVVAQIAGFPVTTLAVDIGDVVQAGDVLATLEDASLKAQLAQVVAQIDAANSAILQAQSQIVSARANADEMASALARTQALVSRGTETQSSLEQALAASRTAAATLASATDGLASARSQLRQVEAQRAVAELNLTHTRLKSPVGGIVAERNINIGDIAAGGTPAFVIYQDAALEVIAQVVETALSSISTGDIVRLMVSGLPETTGTVRLIAPTVDPVTRLGTVHITPSGIEGWRAGLYAGGWIVTETRDGMGVPTTAIQTDSTGPFVFVVNDGVLKKAPVTAGLIWDGQREILAGLNIGAVVVARAGGFFTDGDRVTAVTPEARP